MSNRIVSYKYRETDSTIWISGSGGTSASIADDVRAIKKPNATPDPNYNVRIVGLNNTIGYVTDENQTIPVSSSEELWVYRGYQPIGTGDTNAYNYNPYAHRPYKLYSVVTTQSGFPAFSWLPSGSPTFPTNANIPLGPLYVGDSPKGGGITLDPNSNYGGSSNGMYQASTLAIIGNPTTESYTTQQVSGSFEIYHPEREVYPFIWTRYTAGNFTPPAAGAQFVIRAQSGTLSGSNFPLAQYQLGQTNATPQKFQNVNLPRGIYSYTSSGFDSTGANDSTAFGSTIFGLYNTYDFYVQYKAINVAASPATMRVYYTASNLTSSFFDLAADKQHSFTALAGTPSSSGVGGTLPAASLIEVQFETAQGETVPDLYAYRIDKVYASYSSSLSSSLDGIYVFNQIPQTNVEITSSIRVDAWTGSDPGAKYGSGSYSTSSYGAGELGDGNTWPTCSIKIFKGNFPNHVPAVDSQGNLISTVSQSVLTSSLFHVTQGSPTQHTMSYLMTESIFYRDCISMAVKVESGSAASSSVQNALFVKDYYLEFKNKPIVTGDGLVPTNFEGAFSGSIPFDKAEDCQPFINNISADRENSLYMDVDYQTGLYIPTNQEQIQNRTAQKADVADSNYTMARSIQPRYEGSFQSSFDLNSINGLEGGYGLPPIDYQTAFFGYANEVTDPYPMINGTTQANIKYLIDGSGKATQPNLSTWASYDLESTFQVFSTDPETGDIKYFNRARIAINPDEQQTQYLALQGSQQLREVAKRAEPVVYSQTSSAGYATDIPFGGNPNAVSNFSSDFTNYSLTALGQAWTGDRDDKIFNIYPLAGSSSVSLATTANRPGQATFVDAPFPLLTGSEQTTGGVLAEGGGIKFTTDPKAPTTTSLSDQYTISIVYNQPSTRPQTYKTKKGKWNKKSKYDSTVGDLRLKLMRSTSPSFASVGYQDITFNEPPKVRFYFGAGDYVTLDAITVFGSSNVGIEDGDEIFIIVQTSNIGDVLYQTTGKNYDECTHVEFIINASSVGNLRSDFYYGWRAFGTYDQEPVQDDKNRWNPTIEKENGPPIFPVPQGPTTTIAIAGTKTAADTADNAWNVPYWYYAGTDVTGSALSEDDDNYFSILHLSSSNANDLYGTSIQRTLPYSASLNTFFPGNLEPEDTAWPQQRLQWSLQVGDEIRFENNESTTRKIISVTPPAENQALQKVSNSSNMPKGQLRIELDQPVVGVNLDFFLIRRFVPDASTLIFQTEFPYPGPPGNRTRFITNTGEYISGSIGPSGAPTSSFLPATGSFVELPPEPLSKAQLTTTAIIFPEFPTEDINNEPDLLIEALRNNKLID